MILASHPTHRLREGGHLCAGRRPPRRGRRARHQAGVAAPWPGQGSANPTAAEYGRQHGITVIDGGCPLMFEPTADFGHKMMPGHLHHERPRVQDRVTADNDPRTPDSAYCVKPQLSAVCPSAHGRVRLIVKRQDRSGCLAPAPRLLWLPYPGRRRDQERDHSCAHGRDDAPWCSRVDRAARRRCAFAAGPRGA
jgi:hypothetical protein